MKISALLVSAVTVFLASQPALANSNGAELFRKNCSVCHKLDKKAMGPAVKDMNTDPAILKSVIADGYKAMPSFSIKLNSNQIDTLVTYILSIPTDSIQ